MRESNKKWLFFMASIGKVPKMFEGIAHFFNTYRIATGVYLFSKKEKIVWDLTFIVIIFLFFVGCLKLTISSYHSFVRVFFGSPETAEAVKATTKAIVEKN